MVDFVRFCLEHGLGGLALLAITTTAVLIALLAVATAAMWLVAALVEGFRRGTTPSGR